MYVQNKGVNWLNAFFVCIYEMGFDAWFVIKDISPLSHVSHLSHFGHMIMKARFCQFLHTYVSVCIFPLRPISCWRRAFPRFNCNRCYMSLITKERHKLISFEYVIRYLEKSKFVMRFPTNLAIFLFRKESPYKIILKALLPFC